MKVRCIALDLDGTTLSDAKSVSEGNREGAGGGRGPVASASWWPAGGRWSHIPAAVTAMDLEFEYAVTSNGAAVYRLAGPGRACAG